MGDTDEYHWVTKVKFTIIKKKCTQFISKGFTYLNFTIKKNSLFFSPCGSFKYKTFINSKSVCTYVWTIQPTFYQILHILWYSFSNSVFPIIIRENLCISAFMQMLANLSQFWYMFVLFFFLVRRESSSKHIHFHH